FANIERDRESWEQVVRRLRTGMMPPIGAVQPEPAARKAMVEFLERELDRNAEIYLQPIPPHRVNRSEYANVVRDLLDVQISPAQFLPPDDSTFGFDNMARTLGWSPQLATAFASAAQAISRMAIESPSLQKIFVCQPTVTTDQTA